MARLQRHGPTDVGIGLGDPFAGKAEGTQHVEGKIVQAFGVQAQGVDTEVFAQDPFGEGELDVEGIIQGLLDGADGGLREPFVGERPVVDSRRPVQCAEADRVAVYVVDPGLCVTEGGERPGHHPVDDLETAPTGQLLELDQGEVGLDAGGVAVHHKPDGARGRDDADLGVAEAVFQAQLQGLVPGPAGRVHQGLIGTGVPVERHRHNGQALVTGLVAINRPAVVVDNPEHGLPVFLVTREGAHLAGQFGRGGVGGAGHEGGNGAAQGATRVRIVGDGRSHQVAADVGET